MSNKSILRRTGETLGFVAPANTGIAARAVDGMAAGVMPPSRNDILSISPEAALSIGAVYRAVSIITASVSQMDLGVYRSGTEVSVPSLVRQPNPLVSQGAFLEETTFSLATHGNAYWRVYRGANDTPLSLKVLNPDAVTVTEEKGRVRYYDGPDDVPAANIKHLKLMRKPGHLYGYGPIQHGQSELVGALLVRRFADSWFGSSGVPTGILTTDQKLGPAEAQAFADAWKAFIHENGTAVMSQGMRYEHLNLKPADAQFLEVQQAQTNMISRLWGVPATLMGSGLEGTSTTYVNAQELNIQFLQTTLVKYMNEIEDAFASLLPRGQEVKFKEDRLLRMNTQMQVQVQAQQIQAGLRTANELRAAEGLPALPEPQGPVVEKPNSNEEDESND